MTTPGWATQTPRPDTRFRSLSAPSDEVIWLGGMGCILRSSDGGVSWQDVTPPADGAPEFRSIVALTDDEAVALRTSGPAEIWRTADAGASWRNAYRSDDADTYLDCLAFADDGFLLQETQDAGRTWRRSRHAPPALHGEGAFAASGACLQSARGQLWLATGGTTTPHVLVGGAEQTWRRASVPLPGGPAAGAFAVSVDGDTAIAVGGDYQHPAGPAPAVVRSVDAGRTWHAVVGGPTGYRSGAVLREDGVCVVVGPEGSELSTDGGESWIALHEGFDAVAVSASGDVWASGDQGRVARLVGVGMHGAAPI